MGKHRLVERITAMSALVLLSVACADSGGDGSVSSPEAASTTTPTSTTTEVSTTAAPSTSATSSTGSAVTDPTTTSTVTDSPTTTTTRATTPTVPAPPSGGQPSMMQAPAVLETSSHSVVVGFPAAESPGRAVDRYELAADPGGITVCASSPCTIESLSLGTAYRFRVRAHNSRGWSEWSSWSTSVTPDQVPDMPPPPTAASGDGEAVVSWGPLPNSGTAIVSVTIMVSNGQAFVVSANAGGTAVIAGLTNGTAYWFTISATNAAGTSPMSSASSVVVPAGLPSAPSNLLATLGPDGKSVLLAWAPVNGNGAPVLYFDVWWDGNVVVTIASLSTTLSFPETLVPGSTHTVQVRAVNTVGPGPWTARVIQIPL